MLKKILKLIYSLDWLISFNGNHSLILDDAYGSNWLKFDPPKLLFSSGRTAIIFCGVSVVVLFFHKSCWIVWSIALFVVLGLLPDYYHFLSVLIPGVALGYFVAYSAKPITH